MKQKTYLIFGGSSGIGLGFVKSLNNSNSIVNVVTRDINQCNEKFNKLNNIQLNIFNCDLSNIQNLTETLQLIIATQGLPDYVLYSAGNAMPLTVKRAKSNKVLEIINVNLLAFVELLRGLTIANRNRKVIKVVGISSLGAHLAMPGNGIYTMSKAALESFVKTAAKELNDNNIYISLISPGWVDTPMAHNCPQSIMLEDKFEEFVKNNGQSGGLIPVEFISSFINFVFSLDGKYITGSCIAIPGGV